MRFFCVGGEVSPQRRYFGVASIRAAPLTEGWSGFWRGQGERLGGRWSPSFWRAMEKSSGKGEEKLQGVFEMGWLKVRCCAWRASLGMALCRAMGAGA